MSKVNPLQNLNNAFNVADQKLGLTPLLDAEGESVILCLPYKEATLRVASP